MFDIFSLQGNAFTTAVWYCYVPTRMAKCNNIDITKCWWEFESLNSYRLLIGILNVTNTFEKGFCN